MVTRINLPTRNVVSAVSQGDQRQIKWFEDVTTAVSDLQAGGGGGGGIAESFETVSKNLAAVDNAGEQISATTLVVTYVNGVIKTIVDSGSTVTITLSGAVPGGIDLVKTIVLTGDDFAIVYS